MNVGLPLTLQDHPTCSSRWSLPACLPLTPPLSPLALQLLLQWLAKLAIMSGRVPVWPTVDCSVGYAAGIPQEMMKTPLEVPRGWFPYWSHSWKKVHCFRNSLVREQAGKFSW